MKLPVKLDVLGKLKGRDLFLLTVVLTMLIGLGWYYGLYGAKKAAIDAARSQLDSLGTQVQLARAASAELPALRTSVRGLEGQRDELLRALPAQADIGGVIGEIRGDVLAAGAQLDGITQGAGAASNLPPGVRAIDLNLNLSGTFGQLYRVLRALEDMNRFSTITALGLNMGQADSFDPTLTGTLGVTVYTFDPNAAATPSGTAPDAPAAPAAPSAPPAGATQ